MAYYTGVKEKNLKSMAFAVALNQALTAPLERAKSGAVSQLRKLLFVEKDKRAIQLMRTALVTRMNMNTATWTVKKCLTRWRTVSKPWLLKDCITKVVTHAKLDHMVAIYRMRSLCRKPKEDLQVYKVCAGEDFQLFCESFHKRAMLRNSRPSLVGAGFSRLKNHWIQALKIELVESILSKVTDRTMCRDEVFGRIRQLNQMKKQCLLRIVANYRRKAAACMVKLRTAVTTLGVPNTK